MSTVDHRDESRTAAETEPDSLQNAPEEVPPKAWMTYALFAVFVVGFGSCAALWMFN